jgi:signal transduction histidine kinase
VESGSSSVQLYEGLVDRVIVAAGEGALVKGDPSARAVIRALRRINRVVISASRGVAEPIRALNERAASEEKAATLGVIVIGCVALGLALLMLLMVQLTLRPIRLLRDGVRHIAAGDYSDRVRVRSHDEIGALAGEFNTMAAALEARDAELARQREALLRSERLATVGKMAAQITHEVRNPLSSIGLNVEMLEDELDEGSGDARALLGAIQSEVQRLTEITETYLRYARIPTPELFPCVLRAEVTSCLSFLAPELEEAQIEVDFPDGPDEAAELADVQVDGDQLRQAVLNLVRNAMDALAETGEPRRLEVSFGGDSDWVSVRFHDSGPGLEAELADQIFEPFVTGKSGGTGLGLSLTLQIIEAHGGVIHLEAQAEPLGGAAFRLDLPRFTG